MPVPQYGFFCQYVEDYLMKIGFTEDQLYTGGYTIKTTFDAAATRIAKRAAEAQVPKHTPGINDSMAIIRPGKKRHEVTVLVSNRDYGLNVRADQTQIAYPYGVQNKFGAGSIFKIFTSAAFLEKGGGINTTIKTPHEYTSHLFKGGADSCPSTGEPNTHWYCLSNFGESSGYPAQMPLQNALATSPNTGFVILEETVGMNKVVDMASRLGLRETMGTNMVGQKPNPKSDDPNFNQSQSQFFRGRNGSPGNASFTLSPAPLSTLELANVGATLMSGGVWCPPTPLVEVLDRNGKKVNYSEQPCEQAVDRRPGEHAGHRHVQGRHLGHRGRRGPLVQLDPADARQDRHHPAEQVGRLRRRHPAAGRRGPGVQRRPQPRGHLRQHAGPAVPVRRERQHLRRQGPGPDLVRRDDPDPPGTRRCASCRRPTRDTSTAGRRARCPTSSATASRRRATGCSGPGTGSPSRRSTRRRRRAPW